MTPLNDVDHMTTNDDEEHEDDSYFDILLNSPISSHKVTLEDSLVDDADQSLDQLIQTTNRPPIPIPTPSFHVNDARAVHMEIQENAKIPHAYHIPVRRSSLHDRDDELINEIIRLNEQDITLTEHFLGSDLRSSQSAAYSSAGALMSSIGTMVAGITKDVQDALDAIHDDSSYTPLPSMYSRREPLPIPQNVSPPIPRSLEDNCSLNTGKSSQIQLTAPSSLPLTTSKNGTSSSSKDTTNKLLPLPMSEIYASSNVPSSKSLNHTRLATTNDCKMEPKTSVAQTNISGISKPHTPSMIALKTSTPSIIDATKKRSQFGFGGNHIVPSVPQPPSALHATKVVSSTLNGFSLGKAPQSMVKSTVTEGVSYERKKQRAKDARVNLNESIERLSLSINLAGSQAKERSTLTKSWIKERYKGAELSKVTLSMTEDVIQTADSAKKWNRPSFIGSAASMIQQLNAECQSLMRELIEMKKDHLVSNKVVSKPIEVLDDRQYHTMEYLEQNHKNNSNSEKRRHVALNSDTHHISDSGSFEDSSPCDSSSTIDKESRLEKRQRTDASNVPLLAIHDIWLHEKLCLLVASFLDPRSIIRTITSSKSWRHKLDCFRQDTLWLPLCYNRFGAYNVSECMDFMVESDLGETNCEDSSCSMIDLYREMNNASVSPRCLFQGNAFLGQGTIKNCVAGWASAVERSNGDTRRSVLSVCQESPKYSSLPVVELRIILQNVGISEDAVYIPDQSFSVDASTKRKCDEMHEITCDERFMKTILNLDGSVRAQKSFSPTGTKNLAELRLFESCILVLFIHAVSCPTSAKFKKKAKFLKVLVNMRGKTVPLVIPVHRISNKNEKSIS